MHYAPWLQRFIDVYSELGTEDIGRLESVYHPNVTFIDPLHKVITIDALLRSFERSYTNVMACSFVINHVVESSSQAAVYWEMTFRHTSLNGKKPIVVEGHSYLKEQDGLVIYHRDYLDVGAMIYEHIPLLGGLIKTVKKRAGC
jgi:hypothetical protein